MKKLLGILIAASVMTACGDNSSDSTTSTTDSPSAMSGDTMSATPMAADTGSHDE